MISCWFMVNWKTYKNHKTSKCVCHKMLQSVSCWAKKGWNFIEECWQTHEFINLIQTSLNLISTARKRKQTDKKLLSFTIYDEIVPNIELGRFRREGSYF